MISTCPRLTAGFALALLAGVPSSPGWGQGTTVKQDLFLQSSTDPNIKLHIRERLPSGTDPREMILDELRAANRIVTEKATADEANGYRAWVVQSAKNAAEAAKEGGFFGIGAVAVSEGEQTFLAKVEEAMGGEGSSSSQA